MMNVVSFPLERTKQRMAERRAAAINERLPRISRPAKASGWEFGATERGIEPTMVEPVQAVSHFALQVSVVA